MPKKDKKKNSPGSPSKEDVKRSEERFGWRAGEATVYLPPQKTKKAKP